MNEALRSIITVSWLVVTLVFAAIFLSIGPAFNRDRYPREYFGIAQRLRTFLPR